MPALTVELFSDVLCIWAYGAQVRIDQLKADYGDKVEIRYRFVPIFAAAHERIRRDWGNRGLFEGFNRHLHEVARQWDHVSLHPDVWLNDPPRSSSVAHLYLKALQELEQDGVLPAGPVSEFSGRTHCEEFLWRVRCAFFEQATNIARMSVLDGIAETLEIPSGRVHALIDDGSAHAAFHLDMEDRDRYQVPGSPTLIFNEGRQRLYGNVGYRIIDANISELLEGAQQGNASWC